MTDHEPPTLADLEREDPFAPHDLGCRCYPHVSQRAAIEASVQAATAEYREARATTPAGLREGIENLLRVAFRDEDFLTQNGIPMTATPGVRRALRKVRAALATDEETER